MAQYSGPPSEEGGQLLRNMVLFGRMLRAVGLDVTPTQILDLVEGLEHINLRNRLDVKDASRAIFVNHHDDIALFDQAFDLFWQVREENELAGLDLSAFVQHLAPNDDMPKSQK